MVPNETTLVFILLGVIIALAVWLIRLEFRLGRLLRGRNARTLEDSWNEILSQLKDVQKARSDIETYLVKVEHRLKRSLQGTHTVRFNPFKNLGIGSNQSFATAFLDEEGNGVVVSSLYSRDRVSIYSKPVKKHTSEYELTGEEREAVAKAKPEKI